MICDDSLEAIATPLVLLPLIWQDMPLTLLSRFHFLSIAHDNDATSSNVNTVEILPSPDPSGPSPAILTGRQTVAKYNHTTPDEVVILLAVFRIAEKNVDLVLSFNVPSATANGEGAVDEAGQRRVRTVFDEAVRSLKIVDFGLFA
jgi:hypothetical protein